MRQTKPSRSKPKTNTVRIEWCGRHCSAADVAYDRLVGARIEDVSKRFPALCPVDIAQLEPGTVCCDLEFARSAHAAVSRHRIARQLHLCGTIGEGWCVIGFVRRRGPEPCAGEVTCGASGQSFDWLLRPGDEFFLVGLAQRVFHRVSSPPSVSPYRKEYRRADPEMMEDTVGALSGLLSRAQVGRFAARSFEEVVLETVLEAQSRARQFGFGEDRAMALVERAFRAAGEIRGCVRVSELCLALRVSPRSLLAAFTAVTGMGPHAYFMRQRLSKARHLLASARPRRETVTDVALSAGFTELGRFAGRYRSFFGESPSQTLRRPAGKTACQRLHRSLSV
jgi:AraC-like DNA-binding protein